LITLVFGFLLSAIFPTARAGSQVLVCSLATVKMPSIQQHYNWLKNNHRYGQGMAEDFLKRAKPFGDAYLKYQIRYLSEYPGGSGWYDFGGEIGTHESNVKALKESFRELRDFWESYVVSSKPFTDLTQSERAESLQRFRDLSIAAGAAAGG